jgi:hypothetical protein
MLAIGNARVRRSGTWGFLERGVGGVNSNLAKERYFVAAGSTRGCGDRAGPRRRGVAHNSGGWSTYRECCRARSDDLPGPLKVEFKTADRAARKNVTRGFAKGAENGVRSVPVAILGGSPKT